MTADGKRKYNKRKIYEQFILRFIEESIFQIIWRGNCQEDESVVQK